MDPKDQTNENAIEQALHEDLLSIRESLMDGEEVEPPSLLDQAVMNTARRELASKKRIPARWIGAFATTAVLFLSLTIILMMDNTPVPPVHAPQDAAPKDGIRISPKREAGPAPDLDTAKLRRSQAVRTEEQDPQTEKNIQMAGQSNRFSAEEAEAMAMDAPVPEVSMTEELHDSEQMESGPWVNDPEEWVQRLLALKESRRMEQFRLELAAFQAAYPDRPLPAELKEPIE